MECWVELGDGRELKLPTAARWTFSYGTGTPCDSFSVRCLWEGGGEQVLSGAALFYANWGVERVFTGVVDEFCVVCGGEGLYLELSGRGMAARLLDNEALPVEYQRCTCADLIANHVAPYGVEAVGGRGLPEVSGFTVGSGVSQWSVVEDFVRYHGGVVPRFDRMGRLVLDGHEDGGVLELGSLAPVTAWEYREDRHGVLSRVAVRRPGSGEVQWVEDPAFLAQGGCAQRVVTVPGGAAQAAARYSGDYQLKASRGGRVRLTVTMTGAFLAWPGQLVQVERARLGAGGVYRVAQTEVYCGSGGISTTLVLGERDSII